MHQTTPLVLAVLVVGYALVSERVNRSFIAPALIFLLLGMGLGPFGLHLLEAGPGTEGYTTLAQLALTVILFNQASALHIERLRLHGPVTLRLLIVGIPLTVLLGALTAALLLPILPWWEAVCLAAIVAPTEVALIDALLDDERIPERVRHAMSVEERLLRRFRVGDPADRPGPGLRTSRPQRRCWRCSQCASSPCWSP